MWQAIGVVVMFAALLFQTFHLMQARRDYEALKDDYNQMAETATSCASGWKEERALLERLLKATQR